MINVSNIPYVTFRCMPDTDLVWDALGEHGKVRVDVNADINTEDYFDREFVATWLHYEAAYEDIIGLKINRDKKHGGRIYVYLVRLRRPQGVSIAVD